MRRRAVLQEISNRLVLTTVRLAHRRGLFKGWRGDTGVDTTPVPAWHHESSASVAVSRLSKSRPAGTTAAAPTKVSSGTPPRSSSPPANGRLKSHGINIADPSKRLAHGRVAQTILLALMVCSTNLQMLFSWDQTTGTAADGNLADVIAELTEAAPAPTAANGLSPPQPPPMAHTST